jgi:carbonic anhydrase
VRSFDVVASTCIILSKISYMTSYDEIFENNKKWIEQRMRENKDFFHELARDQKPDYLYIGCSDSRVTAEEIMGLRPGEAFIHRNVANLVNNVDLNVIAVINYAIRHLHVKHIIVCGHYNCGGVKAAMVPKDLGILNPWLRVIRDVYRIHKNELDGIADEQKRYDRLVELNVQEQCINIIKTAALQLSFAQSGFPRVHGWVFDIHTGKIIDLNIDMDAILANIREIYDLTSG